MSSLIGKTLGHFAIIAKLGEGGMGVVYKATDTTLRRTVALKVLPDNVASDPERRRLFIREGRAAAAVTHPNLVTIYEVGEADGHVFLALDFVDGVSLRRRLDEGPMAVDEAVRIARDLARGMARAHEAGIVHRDLKPDNVMIAKDGLIKLLDFGIARVAGKSDPTEPTDVDANTGSTLTLEGRVVGTPGYMSPEQARGKAVDVTTDVFAFGVVLYEMIAGRRPFTGESASDVIVALLRDDPPPLADANAEASPELESLVRRCLAKDSADRFADCGEVGRALDAVLGIAAPESGPSLPRAARSSKPGARGGGVAALTTGFPMSKPADAPSARTTRRAKTWAIASAIGIAVVGGGLFMARRNAAEVSAGPAASASGGADAGSAPVSANPEAARAYQEGVAALRGADWFKARVLFQRALTTDPECTAAALRILLMARYLSGAAETERYRDIYRAVDARRARLSARDAMVLDAIQPFVMRDPPEPALMGERLVAVSQRFPDDAALAFFASLAGENDPAVALRLTDRVLAIDPGYLDAMQVRARALLLAGRPDEGRQQFETCIAQSPGSQCAGDLVALLMSQGKCAAAEDASKSYVRDSAGSDEAYEYYAEAMAGNDAGEPAVTEAIHQGTAKRLPETASFLEQLWLARLDVLHGHFASAERRSVEILKLVDKRPDAAWHQEATFLRGEILRERDDGAALAALAHDFFGRSRVWNHGGSKDRATPALLAGLDELDAMPHAEVVRRANAWFDGSKVTRAQGWMRAAAGSRAARSADEARSWLDRAPIGPPSGSREDMSARAAYGRAMLVAGDAEVAAKTLSDAARSCLVLSDPFAAVRAHLWLGRAREALGDTGGACASYGEVLRRWSVETPLGTTAKAAKARRAALHCP